MHEFKIAEDLSSIVLDVAGKEKLSSVSRINIVFGSMIQIVPDIFDFVFREFIRDSVAKNAELKVEILPVRVKCLECGRESEVAEMNFRCMHCSSREVKVIQGQELYVKSIEGE